MGADGRPGVPHWRCPGCGFVCACHEPEARHAPCERSARTDDPADDQRHRESWKASE